MELTELALRWVIGLLLVAVLAGYVAAELFLRWLRKRMGLEHTQRPGRVPRWLTGLIERFFFTFPYRFSGRRSPTAMVAWLGVKIAANRGRPPPTPEDLDARTNYAFSALLTGLISMFLAVIGGLIAGGKIIWPTALP